VTDYEEREARAAKAWRNVYFRTTPEQRDAPVKKTHTKAIRAAIAAFCKDAPRVRVVNPEYRSIDRPGIEILVKAQPHCRFKNIGQSPANGTPGIFLPTREEVDGD